MLLAVFSFASNIASIRASRQLARSTQEVSTTFERLSSGQRINKASDDAAGIAVAELLNSKTRIASQAVRNLNDGISMVNLATDALQSQTGVLTRMLELAEQSANGTLSYTQRSSLNAEYDALRSEYARIGSSTSMNGISLLARRSDGTLNTLSIQAGFTGDAQSGLSSTFANTSTTGGVVTIRLDQNSSGLLTIGDLTAAGNLLMSGFSLDYINDRLEGGIQSLNVVDSNSATRKIYLALNPHSQALAQNSTGNELTATNVVILTDNGTASPDYNSSVTNATLGQLNATSITFSNGATANFNIDLTELSIRYTDSASFTTQPNVSKYASTRPTALRFTGIESASRARSAMSTVSNLMEDIGISIGELGAYTSRLFTAGRVAATSKESFDAARSRIMDADIAEEAANLVRNQILQQSGAAVLAQANQQPALQLALLKSR